jgi:hypothetical protein
MSIMSPHEGNLRTRLAAKRSVQAVEAAITRSATAKTRRPPSGNFAPTGVGFRPGE